MNTLDAVDKTIQYAQRQLNCYEFGTAEFYAWHNVISELFDYRAQILPRFEDAPTTIHASE